MVKNMRYSSLDGMKTIAAFLVICIHIPFPGEVGQIITAIARIAVPFFFMVSGFFASDNLKKIKINIKNIFILAVLSNLMYLIWYSLITTLSTGEITYYISQTLTLENIVQLLIFNNSPFASHLWYLNAYLYVLVIYYFIIKINISQKIYFLIPILLLTDLAFGTYSLVILGHEVNYIFVRNFLFVGLPYFLLGKLLRNNQLRMRIKVDKTLILLFTIFIFAGTTLIEKYILNQTGMAASREHYLSTTLLVVSIFILLVKNPNLFSGWLSYIGKKYSTGIYIIHFIIIDIYKQILAFLPISMLYVLAPIIVFLISLSLIIFWHQFKKRFKSIFLSGKQNV